MKSSFRTTGAERWSFAMFMAGQGIINSFVGSFLQLYLTNIGLAAISVGTMFLVVRVWDAVNDPLFGSILDKLNLKSGKFLPFIRISIVLLPLSLILLFAIPTGMSPTWMLVWAYVTYLLFDIAYTMSDVPIFALTSAVTDQVHERINILSRNTVLATLAMLVIAIAAPQLIPEIGHFATAAAIAVAAFILMVFMGRHAKERYINKDENKVTLKAILKYVKVNKYLRIGFLGIMILGITNMVQAIMAFFAVNNLGDLGMMTVLMVMLIIPSMVMAILTPKLTKRFDRFHMLVAGIIGQTVIGVISFFVGYENLVAFFVLFGIRCVFFAIQLVLQIQLTGDFVEYGEYVSGKRLQGTAFSIQTFVFKFMNAVPAALAMFVLGIFGFVSGEGAVQPQSAIDAIWVLFTLSPAIGSVIALAVFSKYKLRDKTVQIMADANSGIITREEAEKLLEGRI